MSDTMRCRVVNGMWATLLGLVAFLAALPVFAQDVPAAPVDPTGLDLTSLIAGLVLPYVASGVSIASIVGVAKMVAGRLRRVPGLRLVAALLVKDEGAAKLRPEQVDATLGLVIALSVGSAWGGSIVPLGGEAAGALGRVGAACLVVLLAVGSREGLRAALRPKARFEM